MYCQALKSQYESEIQAQKIELVKTQTDLVRKIQDLEDTKVRVEALEAQIANRFDNDNEMVEDLERQKSRCSELEKLLKETSAPLELRR